MTTSLQSLARWAAGLDPSDLPRDVAMRARLQHLSTLGAVRAAVGHLPGAWVLTSGGRTPVLSDSRAVASRRDAVRLHAALAALHAFDDHLFAAHTSGGVAAAWAWAGDHSLQDLLAATVVANEVAGRLGASTLLGPAWGRTASWTQSLASAAATARLLGLDARATAHAYALALQLPAVLPWRTLLGGAGRGLALAAPVVAGLEAALQASAGGRGDLDTLDTRQGFFGRITPLPLRAAFTGLGQAWLTRSLAFRLMPGAEHLQVPVQAVWEILRRHVKAADKRLRVDQWDRVELGVDAVAFGLEQVARAHPGVRPGPLPYAIARSIGALGVAYELGPSQLDAGWLATNEEAIAGLASRVELFHDWRATQSWVEHLLDVGEPLFAGVRPSELRRAGRDLLAANDAALGTPNAHEIFEVLKRRPDRVLSRVGRGSGDLADMDVEALRFRHPVEVKLYTTRGGWWPERRDTAEGAPGWSWEATVSGVLDKAASGEPERRGTVAGLLETAGSEPAAGWVEALLRS